MRAPRLERLNDVVAAAGLTWQQVPAGFREAGAFAVTAAGEFGGRWFEAGTVLRADGACGEGEPIVLVPVDPARPRFGTSDRGMLFGDRGEPCSPVRWRAVGALGASAPCPAIASWLERSSPSRACSPGVAALRAVAERAQQLWLFGQAMPA